MTYTEVWFAVQAVGVSV